MEKPGTSHGYESSIDPLQTFLEGYNFGADILATNHGNAMARYGISHLEVFEKERGRLVPDNDTVMSKLTETHDAVFSAIEQSSSVAEELIFSTEEYIPELLSESDRRLSKALKLMISLNSPTKSISFVETNINSASNPAAVRASLDAAFLRNLKYGAHTGDRKALIEQAASTPQIAGAMAIYYDLQGTELLKAVWDSSREFNEKLWQELSSDNIKAAVMCAMDKKVWYSLKTARLNGSDNPIILKILSATSCEQVRGVFAYLMSTLHKQDTSEEQFDYEEFMRNFNESQNNGAGSPSPPDTAEQPRPQRDYEAAEVAKKLPRGRGYAWVEQHMTDTKHVRLLMNTVRRLRRDNVDITDTQIYHKYHKAINKSTGEEVNPDTVMCYQILHELMGGPIGKIPF